MKYLFVMKEGYHETKFVFDSFTDGCCFMKSAIVHSGMAVCFEVSLVDMEGNDEE